MLVTFKMVEKMPVNYRQNIQIFLLVIYFYTSSGENCKHEHRCKVSKVYGMKAADCYQKDIRIFPQCIGSDMEIIDLTMNRIRKISVDDIRRYTYLKMLYLSDNLIMSIEPGALDLLTNLQTLDLSINALTKLPSSVFHLPSLKSLYLGQNVNMNIVEIIEDARPIRSPLAQLDLSYILTDEPGNLPIFGIMPYLRKFNISGNRIHTLTTTHFAGLCNLQVMDTLNVTVEFDDQCDCLRIDRWLRQRQVRFSPFQCETTELACSTDVISEDLATYKLCREEVETIILQSRLKKILIPISIILATVSLVFICMLIKKRKRRI